MRARCILPRADSCCWGMSRRAKLWLGSNGHAKYGGGQRVEPTQSNQGSREASCLTGSGVNADPALPGCGLGGDITRDSFQSMLTSENAHAFHAPITKFANENRPVRCMRFDPGEERCQRPSRSHGRLQPRK